MAHDPDKILSILDACCRAFTFPMLDNGYVYLAGSRLSGYYSQSDWALVIEIFGYSPRAGFPDINVYTFASTLHDRDKRGNYVNEKAYQMYLTNHPNNESRFFWPIDGKYQDPENDELISEDGKNVILRQNEISIPDVSVYAVHGIELIDAPRVHVFELCRYIAELHRESCLATESERRCSLLPEMQQVLQLEEWRHPDLLNGELPRATQSFQQIARVLASGNIEEYMPIQISNTHWCNWPEGGTL